MSYQATHDALTGLINRHEFERRLDEAMDTAHADEAVHMLFYMDLDRFKAVNDSCGHVAGDNMLREVGLSIADCGGKVTFAGKEPVRRTVMKAGAAPAIILAANAVAEAAIWKERTGEGQDIHVDLRKAWIEQSPWQVDAIPYTLINGVSKMFNMGVYVVENPIVPTRDGRWMCRC